MDGAAITRRLRLTAELLRARGVVKKGVDMSPAAVTERLHTLAALSELCRRLTSAGETLRR
jgi:hypothetical protein